MLNKEKKGGAEEKMKELMREIRMVVGMLMAGDAGGGQIGGGEGKEGRKDWRKRCGDRGRGVGCWSAGAWLPSTGREREKKRRWRQRLATPTTTASLCVSLPLSSSCSCHGLQGEGSLLRRPSDGWLQHVPSYVCVCVCFGVRCMATEAVIR